MTATYPKIECDGTGCCEECRGRVAELDAELEEYNKLLHWRHNPKINLRWNGPFPMEGIDKPGTWWWGHIIDVRDDAKCDENGRWPRYDFGPCDSYIDALREAKRLTDETDDNARS